MLPRICDYFYLLAVSICFFLGADAVADDWDPSDNAATNGTVITMGEAAKLHGPHSVDLYDYYDWYRIHLTAGKEYRFNSIGEWDTKAWLYLDPNDAALVVDDDNGIEYNFQLDYSPALSGDYYLQVGTYTEGIYAEYDLLYYIPANDSDGDQLLDTWEIQYFGDLTTGPTNSSDDDSFNDLDEYIAGTDPTNSDSFFAITNGSAGSFIIEWPSVASRQYRVLWTESLTNRFDYTSPWIDHPQNSYTDTLHSADDSGFYRVEVQFK